MLPFRPLVWEDREIYTNYYQRCPVHYAEYSFFGLWGWIKKYQLELAFDDSLCWIRSNGPFPGICGPIGNWNVVDWRSALTKNFATGNIIFDVPKEAAELIAAQLDGAVEITPNRNQWEYLHSVSELVALKGSKYAHKRNRVRTFMSNYDYDYYPMLPEDFSAVMNFQERWRTHRNATMSADEAESLYDEDLAIQTAFNTWDDFPFLGGILKVDDEIIAYTIAEELDSSTLDIRVEKAFGEYAGSYQAINQLFLKNQGQGYTWVNREEDMGEEGLRAAKLSYNPVKMLEKYNIKIKTGGVSL